MHKAVCIAKDSIDANMRGELNKLGIAHAVSHHLDEVHLRNVLNKLKTFLTNANPPSTLRQTTTSTKENHQHLSSAVGIDV